MSIIDKIKKIVSASVEVDKPGLKDIVKVVRTKGGESVAEIENSGSVTFGSGKETDKDEEVIWGNKTVPKGKD